MPTYDAILIDEYQDFKDHWIQLCLKVCKKHEHNGVETENLFLAGDRLQSIYNSKGHSWKSIGVNIVGRSKLLKTSYRSGSDHINLALDYLMDDEKLRKEIEKFYEGRDGVSCISDIDNSIDFVRGNMESVNGYLKDLFASENYSPEDVVVLLSSSDNIEAFYRYLDDELRPISFSGNYLQSDKMNITTYHRSKGLEYKACVLLDVDSVKSKKVLYVGMTRASEKLCIHSFSSEGGRTFSDLMSYYDEMVADVVPETVVYDHIITPSREKKKFLVKEIQKEFPNAYTPWTKSQEMKLISCMNPGSLLRKWQRLLGGRPAVLKPDLKNWVSDTGNMKKRSKNYSQALYTLRKRISKKLWTRM